MGIWGFGFGFVSFVSRKVSVSPRTLPVDPEKVKELLKPEVLQGCIDEFGYVWLYAVSKYWLATTKSSVNSWSHGNKIICAAATISSRQMRFLRLRGLILARL